MPKPTKTIFFLIFSFSFLVAFFFFSGFITFGRARFVLASVLMIYLGLIAAHGMSSKSEASLSGSALSWTLGLIFLNGILIRLILANSQHFNHDVWMSHRLSQMLSQGLDPYELTNYNTTPLWFIFLNVFGKLASIFEGIPYPFIHRAFTSGVDLLTLLVLLRLAELLRSPKLPIALFFYLNPVSVLISGFHGQFDNFALLIFFSGIFLYYYFGEHTLKGKASLWGLSTLGMTMKHIIFYEVIVALNVSIRRRWVRLLLFGGTVLIFLMSFGLYWQTSAAYIVRNVFLYSSEKGFYGLTSLFGYGPVMPILFVVGLVLFPFFILKRDLLTQALLSILFFLTFTTGIGQQYFVLPIALGAFRPSLGFFVYSIVGSCFLLGAQANLHVPYFDQVPWNAVWLAALFWFVTELFGGRKVSDCVLREHRIK